VSAPPDASGPAPRHQGYLDERSTHHVAGWVRNPADPAERVAFEVVLPDGDREHILHRGIADRFSAVLHELGVGDGAYAFRVRFAAALSPAGRDALFVRPAGTGRAAGAAG